MLIPSCLWRKKIMSKPQRKTKKVNQRIVGEPLGWTYGANRKADFETGLDAGATYSGTRSAYLRSKVRQPESFGYLRQCFSPPENYLGKRLRMSAWMKTRNVKEGCQLWLRVDVEGRNTNRTGPCHDNMYDRRVTGTTDWTRYDLVVDVPQTATTSILELCC